MEPHLGTLVGITIYVASVDEAKAAFARGFARIAALGAMLSDYRADSELNGIGLTPKAISPEMETVLRFAQTLAERTGGAFDVTAGALIRHWRKEKTFPPESLVSGYRHLHLAKGRAWLDDAG